MIADTDRYHGAVLKQILVCAGKSLSMGIADVAGRVDTFHVGQAAFQVKHSSKRLSPWQFTFLPDHVNELVLLGQTFAPVWSFFVCGHDGIVGLALEELLSACGGYIAQPTALRVSRARHEMYRIAIGGIELSRPKPRGVEPFLAALSRVDGLNGQ
ncbi:MAG TPA: hypothetical protein VNI54_14595 [Thermoanaerobaculia bacterium]|nr:hypothetical protein [Thermoanaerobaculia bacterium]